jgi:TolB-like protein
VERASLKAVDLKQIGRDLNVRYVLEGSVQRGGNRMRVSAELVAAALGAAGSRDRHCPMALGVRNAL